MEVIVSNMGQFCLLFAFCLSCYAMVASFLGGQVGHRRLVDTAERSMVAVCVLVTLTVGTDRKSTRLNSSHRTISYAVFCLKKKKKNKSKLSQNKVMC